MYSLFTGLILLNKSKGSILVSLSSENGGRLVSVYTLRWILLLTTFPVNMSDDSILGVGDGAFEINQASSVGEVDGWIENLMACKQLSEVDVGKLCDKVFSLLATSHCCRSCD